MQNPKTAPKQFSPEATAKANATLLALLNNDDRLEAAAVVLVARDADNSHVYLNNITALEALESIKHLTHAVVENG